MRDSGNYGAASAIEEKSYHGRSQQPLFARPAYRHALIVVAIAGLYCAAAGLVGNEYYLRIMFMMAVYFLCAVGMNVLVGYAGQKSLGQAGLFAAGAYSAALATTQYDLPAWSALPIAAAVAGLFGVLIALPSLRVKGPYLAMVTLAFGVVIEKIVTEWDDVFGGAAGISGIKPLTLHGSPLTTEQWVWFGIALCAGAHLLIRNLLKGRFGRALLSIQADEIAAASVGVRVYKTKVLAFVIAAVCCGLAGAMVAQQNQYINSDFINFNLSVFILLLVLFGGAGNLWGPLLGAFSLTIIDAVLSRWPFAQHFVYGMMLLLSLYLMPNGIAGVFVNLGRRSGIASRLAATRNAGDGRPMTAAVMQKTTGTLLRVDDVSKSYGGVHPARHVSFSLTAGHIHALIGPNGAGKSTMVNILTGIVKPDHGAIDLLGTPIHRTLPHQICVRGVGRTFQNLRLFKELSVLDNVLLGCHSRMKNGFWTSLLYLPNAAQEERAAKARALSILRFVGLEAQTFSRAGSLSYGLERRVELARALATEPKILLLDEPAAGLNPQETQDLGALISRIRELGITILMVEHHMDLVMAISDHIVVLEYGVKIAEGTPAQVQADPAVIKAYLGTAGEE